MLNFLKVLLIQVKKKFPFISFIDNNAKRLSLAWFLQIESVRWIAYFLKLVFVTEYAFLTKRKILSFHVLLNFTHRSNLNLVIKRMQCFKVFCNGHIAHGGYMRRKKY